MFIFVIYFSNYSVVFDEKTQQIKLRFHAFFAFLDFFIFRNFQEKKRKFAKKLKKFLT